MAASALYLQFQREEVHKKIVGQPMTDPEKPTQWRMNEERVARSSGKGDLLSLLYSFSFQS